MAFTEPTDDSGLISSVVRQQLDKAAPCGIMLDYLGTVAPTGWVLACGNTIGSATSGGTERANADTEDLFEHLWTNFSNTILVIQDSAGTPTTRGLSAAADFAANKRMPVPDLRGKTTAGLDNMGGTSANIVVDVAADTAGDDMGTETHTLIISEMPAHTHSVAIQSGQSDGGPQTIGANATGQTGSTGGDGAHNNMQPTMFFAKIVKL